MYDLSSQTKLLPLSTNSLARALLPAVAVCGGGGPLQLAVVALVADAGALGAAAQRVRQAAGPALEDVLRRGCRQKYTLLITKSVNKLHLSLVTKPIIGNLTFSV